MLVEELELQAAEEALEGVVEAVADRSCQWSWAARRSAGGRRSTRSALVGVRDVAPRPVDNVAAALFTKDVDGSNAATASPQRCR
jgi:hypothetical protein